MAEKLGKMIFELNEMPYREFCDWLEYFKYNSDQEKKALEKAKKRGIKSR